MTTIKSGGKASQHLRTTDLRLGSRSPNSIPSSPNSVHSSSSAIFERDIEPIIPPSPPATHHYPINPHRIPRSKGTEQIEHSVPSVLDSAAAILASIDDLDIGDQVAVISPVSPVIERGLGSGFASPIGSFRSRSPSPLGVRMAVPGQLLLNPSIVPHSTSPTCVLGLHDMTSPLPSTLATRPVIVTSPPSSAAITLLSQSNSTSTSTPSIVTPTSAYYSTVSDLENQSPITTIAEYPPNPVSPALVSPQSAVSSPLLPPTSLSLPPSPQVAKKRLSFMSYSDLLSSTPASTQPLSSLTTCASLADPPSHLASVSGLHIVNSSGVHESPFLPFSGHGGLKGDNITMLDNVGGEWEREGLGRGLEERLEALVIPGAMIASPVVYPVV